MLISDISYSFLDKQRRCSINEPIGTRKSGHSLRALLCFFDSNCCLGQTRMSPLAPLARDIQTRKVFTGSFGEFLKGTFISLM